MSNRDIARIDNLIARLNGALQVIVDIMYSDDYTTNNTVFVQKHIVQHLQTQLYITEQILDEVKNLKEYNEELDKYLDLE